MGLSKSIAAEYFHNAHRCAHDRLGAHEYNLQPSKLSVLESRNSMRNLWRFLGWPTLCGILAGLLILTYLEPAVFGGLFSRSHVVKDSYADAVSRAAPAVVNIYTSKTIRSQITPMLDDPLGAPLLQSRQQPAAAAHSAQSRFGRDHRSRRLHSDESSRHQWRRRNRRAARRWSRSARTRGRLRCRNRSGRAQNRFAES